MLIEIIEVFFSALFSALTGFSIEKYFKTKKLYWFILGLIAGNLVVFSYYFVFKFGNPTTLYVIIKILSILIILLLSYLFLNTTLSIKQYIGIVFSIITIYLLH